jgi:hypothetical protein
MACELLPPSTRACLFLFEQHMIQLQNFISKRLHDHTIFNMLFDKIFKAHRIQILTCFNPRASMQALSL